MPDGSRTSAISPRVRWTMPSVADLIFVVLLALLLCTSLSVRLLGDAGIGWHIRTGQAILATHSIPRTDPFSSSQVGRPSLAHQWFAWEWLYDVIVGKLEAALGLNGVVWFNALVISAVFAVLFHLLMRHGTNLGLALGLALLALLASMIHFLARPHVVSWLFTLTWFAILDARERDDRAELADRRHRWLWVLPLLMLVWVNVHGGFLVGFVLFAIFGLGTICSWISAKSGQLDGALQKIAARRRLQQFIQVAAVSLLASFVNPYGWKLHRHIYAYLSNRFLMSHIEEFQSPNFHSLAPRCFLLLLLIAIAALAWRGRRLRTTGVLTILFAVYSGLYASRNIPVSSILLVLVIAPLLTWEPSAAGFLSRMQKVDSTLRGHMWPIIAAVVTMVIAANGGRLGSAVVMNAHFDPKRMPVDAVNYLEKNSVPGPILGPDSWGGYLIYRLYPTQRVVIDDRHDFYGEEYLKSYLKMLHVERGWQDFLRAQQPSCLLLPRDAALANVLAETRDWKPVYSDDVAIAFVPVPSNSH